MLNKSNERELAYVAKVTNIAPMDAERLECVYINGWTCVCGKGDFHIGDVGVFFEPDSQLPEVFPFTEIGFLASKHYKVKPQKIRGVVSCGLFMPLSAFVASDGSFPSWLAATNLAIAQGCEETIFLTKELGVTYAVSEDNHRKAPSIDKYKRMAQRHPTAAKTRLWRWLWRYKWGKKLLFLFFGKKRDKRSAWPVWVVKTDEERVQNMPWLFTNELDTRWIATEKVDGTSTTFTLRNGKFYVCSRNVVFDKPDKKCFYETNVYTEMAEKYNVEAIMRNALKIAQKENRKIDFLTIQAETFGQSVQKRDYGLDHREMRIFNIIWGFKDGTTKRLNPIEGKAQADVWALPYVPIVDEDFRLPTTCDELLVIANGISKIDGGLREGLVFRSMDGTKSFKAVDPEYLVKYHG